MAVKLFELEEHFMIEKFLMKLTKFEKTRSISLSFAEKSVKFSVSKLEVDHILRDSYSFAVRLWSLPFFYQRK